MDGERVVNWSGPGVVRVAVPPKTDTSERYVQTGRRIAKGVCVFDRSGGQSGRAATVKRDWLLAYEGRSCRALMARAAAP